MGLGARSNIRSKYLRTRSSRLTSSHSRYWSLWTRIWVIRGLVQRKLKTNIICYTNSLHRLISLAGKHRRKNGWFLICHWLLLMELSLITEKLRAIAFPLETCSSPINAKHIGGTNEKIMTWNITISIPLLNLLPIYDNYLLRNNLDYQ